VIAGALDERGAAEAEAEGAAARRRAHPGPTEDEVERPIARGERVVIAEWAAGAVADAEPGLDRDAARREGDIEPDVAAGVEREHDGRALGEGHRVLELVDERGKEGRARVADRDRDPGRGAKLRVGVEDPGAFAGELDGCDAAEPARRREHE